MTTRPGVYLRQAIRWLRETMPEGALCVEGQSVWIGCEVAVVSESAELQELLAEAARQQGRERLDAMLKALAIYEQGPFLPGARGEWADEREQQLVDDVTEARYQAAVLAFGDDRYDESRTLAEAVLRHDRYREPAWRLLMRVAQALGDDEGATRAFKACEQALPEIGAEPSASTRLLLTRSAAGEHRFGLVYGPLAKLPGMAVEATELTSRRVFDPEIYSNGDPTTFGLPLDLYERMREEEPLVKLELGHEILVDEVWVASRHADIWAIDKDPETFAANRGLVNIWKFAPLDPVHKPAMLVQDGDEQGSTTWR